MGRTSVALLLLVIISTSSAQITNQTIQSRSDVVAESRSDVLQGGPGDSIESIGDGTEITDRMGQPTVVALLIQGKGHTAINLNNPLYPKPNLYTYVGHPAVKPMYHPNNVLHLHPKLPQMPYGQPGPMILPVVNPLYPPVHKPLLLPQNQIQILPPIQVPPNKPLLPPKPLMLPPKPLLPPPPPPKPLPPPPPAPLINSYNPQNNNYASNDNYNPPNNNYSPYNNNYSPSNNYYRPSVNNYSPANSYPLPVNNYPRPNNNYPQNNNYKDHSHYNHNSYPNNYNNNYQQSHNNYGANNYKNNYNKYPQSNSYNNYNKFYPQTSYKNNYNKYPQTNYHDNKYQQTNSYYNNEYSVRPYKDSQNMNYQHEDDYQSPISNYPKPDVYSHNQYEKPIEIYNTNGKPPYQPLDDERPPLISYAPSVANPPPYTLNAIPYRPSFSTQAEALPPRANKENNLHEDQLIYETAQVVEHDHYIPEPSSQHEVYEMPPQELGQDLKTPNYPIREKPNPEPIRVEPYPNKQQPQYPNNEHSSDMIRDYPLNSQQEQPHHPERPFEIKHLEEQSYANNNNNGPYVQQSNNEVKNNKPHESAPNKYNPDINNQPPENPPKDLQVHIFHSHGLESYKDPKYKFFDSDGEPEEEGEHQVSAPFITEADKTPKQMNEGFYNGEPYPQEIPHHNLPNYNEGRHEFQHQQFPQNNYPNQHPQFPINNYPNQHPQFPKNNYPNEHPRLYENQPQQYGLNQVHSPHNIPEFHSRPMPNLGQNVYQPQLNQNNHNQQPIEIPVLFIEAEEQERPLHKDKDQYKSKPEYQKGKPDSNYGKNEYKSKPTYSEQKPEGKYNYGKNNNYKKPKYNNEKPTNYHSNTEDYKSKRPQYSEDSYESEYANNDYKKPSSSYKEESKKPSSSKPLYSEEEHDSYENSYKDEYKDEYKDDYKDEYKKPSNSESYSSGENYDNVKEQDHYSPSKPSYNEHGLDHYHNIDTFYPETKPTYETDYDKEKYSESEYHPPPKKPYEDYPSEQERPHPGYPSEQERPPPDKPYPLPSQSNFHPTKPYQPQIEHHHVPNHSEYLHPPRIPPEELNLLIVSKGQHRNPHYHQDMNMAIQAIQKVPGYQGNNIPGIPGKDYPVHRQIPRTDFRCKNNLPGFFADPNVNCQVWHYCQPDGRKDTFLCPNGTAFNQKNFACDWWYNVECRESPQFYYLNTYLYQELDQTAYKDYTEDQYDTPQATEQYSIQGKLRSNEDTNYSEDYYVEDQQMIE